MKHFCGKRNKICIVQPPLQKTSENYVHTLPLLSPGKAIFEVLFGDSFCAFQFKTRNHWRAGPAEGYKDVQGSGASSLLRGKAEEAGPVQLREETAEQRSYQCVQIP